MESRLFIVSCELTSGFSLNLAKKSKGMFGSLKDEDFLSPVSNVLGIWDKIKGVSSDINFQISSEIIFCAHLLGGKNKKRSSTDFTPTGNVTDQFFVKDTVVGSNLSTQNTRLFDLRENIDFGKIQILNTIKSDGNLVDGYQVGIVSIFSAEDPSNIIKFQQKVSTSVSGKGNATISFIEIEESRNISFSGISVDSKKITGKLSGDYSDKRPLSEIRSGMVILAEHFSDVCGDASLKKLLDNQNREDLIHNNSISKNQTSSDIIDKSNYPKNRKLLERLTWEEVGSYKYKSEISTSYIESGVSVEDFCNEYEISKEELIAFVNETHPGVLVNGENRGIFNSIFFISLVKIDAAGWTEPLNKPDMLVMQNLDTDYCEFLIDTSRNSIFKSTEDGQRSAIDKLVTVYDALDELTNIHPELNEEIAIELFAGFLDGDTNDFEYESDLSAEIIEESSAKTENFKGKIGIRIAKIDGVKISKSKALINIDGSEYNSIDEITSFLMDHGNIQYTFVSDERKSFINEENSSVSNGQKFHPGSSRVSFSEEDLNRLEAAKEDYKNLKNLSKQKSLTLNYDFDKIYHLSLVKVISSINEYLVEPASSKNLTILHNTETDQCAFIIGELKNQTWLLSNEGFLGGSEYFILELLEEPNNLRTGKPIYNLDIGANNEFITGVFEKDFSDFEFETQMVANIGGAQYFESPEFLGCYGLRLITAEAEVEINGEKLKIFNETYEDEGDLFEFLETCNVEFAFASHP